MVYFERALFFSWYCDIRDCKFCFMSTQPPGNASIRHWKSVVAEALIAKAHGWRVSFLSGGLGAYQEEKVFDLVKEIIEATGEKLFLNVGPLDEKQIIWFTPFIKGVVGAIETVNWKLRKELCPSKPLQPYLDMFKIAYEMGLENAMTMIIGLGETHKDYTELKKFIKENHISKIHLYCLNPQKGTIFENIAPPTGEEQAWWIASLRKDFPLLHICAGIWLDKTDRIPLLLDAGANSLTKFPITRYFGSKEAHEFEKQIALSGKQFHGTFTKPQKVTSKNESIQKILDSYSKKMKRFIK